MVTVVQPGITIRDWFAATANEGDIQNAIERLIKIKYVRGYRENEDERALARYMHADYMITELQKAESETKVNKESVQYNCGLDDGEKIGKEKSKKEIRDAIMRLPKIRKQSKKGHIDWIIKLDDILTIFD
jgi:hypothetical protein